MMSTFSLGLHILAVYVIFLAHRIQGGRVDPTTKEAFYEQAFPSSGAYDNDTSYFAAQATYAGSYFGLVATMDVYGYNLTEGQVSTTGIWIVNLEGDYKSNEDSISVGWQVYPKHYRDSRTRFFTHWTRDAYRSTGCFDMECPGFQLASGPRVPPGTIIDPVSDAGVPPRTITIKVFKDKSTGDWWIHAGLDGSRTTPVGYYPAKLFDTLSKKATHIGIGGVVGGLGTIPPPPMGSGSLPSDKAASISDISFVEEDGTTTPFAVNTVKYETKSSCYSITPIVDAKCSYGGPGGCSM